MIFAGMSVSRVAGKPGQFNTGYSSHGPVDEEIRRLRRKNASLGKSRIDPDQLIQVFSFLQLLIGRQVIATFAHPLIIQNIPEDIVSL
jgi:hypothetical protein